ncbi:transcription elongation factor GreAB [Methylobacterium radiodurans]|uniref:Transcription elongation factor GreAB n=1 Tax=Methylobacterium radiodurans TaxID=2202828 RepID=A0A2U8VNC6_9HYPH|nr:transcription elongation factor GreAB [Methylobacterium radiodurans]AWN35123.1 transcription elongation factor GreAB [Methylobacterium radiodurans]
MSAVRDLPPITVSNRDFDQLVAFGLAAGSHDDPEIGFLLSELQRATLCAAPELPGRVVSLNRLVRYRLDEEPVSREDFLVHPRDLVDPDKELSAASSLGVALLGLGIGDSMPFHDPSIGIERLVHVDGVGPRHCQGLTEIILGP